MAGYFAGSGAGTDVQAGTNGLQTLYLMNPNYVGYADAAAGAPNMMLLNSAVGSLTPASFGHQPAAAQHFVGIPLQPPPSGYNLWGPATTGGAAGDASPRQLPPGAPAVSAVLSLSSREAPPVTVAAVPFTEGKYMAAPPTPSQEPEHAVMSSKYLKAAQELLDEAVSVKGVEEANTAAEVAKSATAVKKKEGSEGWCSGAAEDGGGSKSGGGAEMSTVERQELQMKKSKLLNMLDEVDRRYRQYQKQTQAVAAAFEAAAGAGAARTYTALALRTISRQFRCLRDAIAAQARAAGRALGEAAGDAGEGTVGSRLRFIDHQLRQQRALQQLGMMQMQGGAVAGAGAWRPQRGLPERSVSVLRAWLFEHFLHPYPKDSDKIMLAKQTGLTRSQVSNWFINARVRLWKPMVEEMYAEETKGKDAGAAAGDGDDDSGGGSRSNNTGSTGAPKHGENNGTSPPVGTSPSSSKAAPRPRVAATGGSETDVHSSSLLEFAGEQQAPASLYSGGGGASFQHKLKKARADDEPAAFHSPVDVAGLQAQAARHVGHRELLMKFMEAGSGGGAATGTRGHLDDDGEAGGYSLFTPAPYAQFGSEQYAFAGSGGGGVSLTLGLPRGAAAADHTASFLMSSSNAGDGVAAGYDMNMQSTKQSFAAQLMRDFVA